MAATKAQLECIQDTFGVPSAVVAGAGSGKTETLTNRVVYALQHPERSGVDDIDQILAITYTNKAAAELKSRIKGALSRAATPDNGLALQALKVDGAWISTIHGMCSRILKENAFTFGVDPSFSLASEEVCSQLLDEAIEQVIGDPRDDTGSGDLPMRVQALFDEYRRSKVKSVLADLVKKAAEANGELAERFVLQPQADMVDSLLMATAYSQEVMARYIAAADAKGKPLGKRGQDYCDGAASAVRAVLALSAEDDAVSAVVGTERLGQLRLMEDADLLRLASLFPKPHGGDRAAKEPLGPDGLSAQMAIAGCLAEMRLSVGAGHLRTLVELAGQVRDAFAERKRELGCLDNDDLLSLVARALGDPANAAIARRYAEQFRLVMVDEFQDTNQMQVDMINLVAGGVSDAPSEKLCVVGDAQQSIYRFRNADLSVFTEHVRRVGSSPEGKVISLGDNFRSHADILAFTKGVFTSVFGDTYLDLLHGRDEERAAESGRFYGAEGDGEDAQVPRRVNVKVFGTKGIASISARAAEAIAQDFKTLCERGNKPGQMAILLGVMTHADEYAAALQAVGLKCAITGGTVFRDSVEAKLIVDLCYALADVRHTKALASVLTSDLFCLEARDLLRLMGDADGQGARTAGDGREARARRGDLSGLFASCVRDGSIPEDVSPLLASALRVLARAARRVGSRRMSALLEDVLAESGWLGRMSGEDQVRVGNAFKAIRMVHDIESEGAVGALRLARQLDARIATLKEPPGVLSAEGDDFVRIMTIHASKGLSIPIVAVAEAEFSARDRSTLKSFSHEGRTYLALDADGSLESLDDKSFLAKSVGDFASACDDLETGKGALAALGSSTSGAVFVSAIKKLNLFGDIEEHQRKLYVAYTRAKDALIVAMKKMGDGPSKREEGAIDAPHAIADLLFGSEAPAEFTKVPEEVRQLVKLHTAYPNAPAHDLDWTIRFEAFPAPDDEGGDSSDAAGGDGLHGEGATFTLPVDEPASSVFDVPYSAQWAEGIFSASSLKKVSSAAEFGDDPALSAPVQSAGDSALPVPTCSADDRAFPDPVQSAGDSALPAPGWFVGDSTRVPLQEMADDPAHASRNGEPFALTFDDDDEPPAPATERGTAFHALCEWSARRWQPGQRLVSPPSERVAAIARSYGLNGRQARELSALLERWLDSPQAQRAARFAHVAPECPFWVKLADGTADVQPLVMQGFIDLLAYDEQGKGEAYVIDYKTGTRLDTDAKRRAAYGIQAQCYAYALLMQGFDEVKLDFCFVDQPDAPVTSFPAEGEPPYTAESLRDALLAAMVEDISR